MSPAEWVGVVVGIATILGAIFAGIKWLVKAFLAELKPNGGDSMNDRLRRVEDKLEALYFILIEKSRKD